MTPAKLQAFLHSNIPASAALRFSVGASDTCRVELSAPIEANRNHHQTVFGGSTAMLATLCGWSLVHLNFPECGGRIVIQEGHTRYLKPAAADLTAVCESPGAEAWAACAAGLAARGRGKITLVCRLFSAGVLAAEFEGKYVVMAGPHQQAV